MRRGTQIKMGLVLIGTISLAYSAYLRSLGDREYVSTIVGLVLILAGIISFFIGGESEEDIDTEEAQRQS